MADTAEAERVLLEQAAALELEVDGRWSVETLADKVLKAQRAKDAAEKAAYAKAKKVAVRLRKNAFPVTGEKALKGSIVEVPIDLAKRWITEGVADRADPFPGE
jgi:hypothetical protein